MDLIKTIAAEVLEVGRKGTSGYVLVLDQLRLEAAIMEGFKKYGNNVQETSK